MDYVIEGTLLKVGKGTIVGAVDWTDETAQEYLNPTPSFEENQTAKLKELLAWHDNQIQAMTTNYSKAEVDAFEQKRKEAIAYTIDNTTVTPYLLGMANQDPVALEVLVTAIMAKVNAVAYLDGIVDTKRDAIQASITQTQLDAVTW